MARLRRRPARALTAAGLPLLLALVLALVTGGARLTAAEEPDAAAPSDGLYDRPVLVLDPGAHTAAIRRLDADREGRFLVTASLDKTIRVWDARDGTPLRALRLPAGPGDAGKAFAAAISPDGTLVAAGGWTTGVAGEESVYLFDRASGRLLRRVGGLPNAVSHLAFSPNGSKLATALGGTAGVRLIDPAAGAVVAADEGYGGESYGAAFDPASGRLATTSYDGRVRLYDRDLRLQRSTEPPGGRRPLGLAFSPDGGRLAVGYDDTAAVDVLDGATLGPLFPADAAGVAGGNLSKVAWSADGGTLHAAGRWPLDGDSRLRTWPGGGRGAPADRPLAGDTMMALRGLPGGRLAFAAQDPRLGVLGADGRAVWEVGPPIADYRSHGNALAVSEDGARVRFGYEYLGASPAVFSVPDLRLEQGGDERGLDEPRLEARGLAVEDWEDTRAPTLNGERLPLYPYEASRSLAVAPDGEHFVLGAEWSLRLFDREGQELWRRPVPDAVWGVNVTGDGRLVVAAYGDGTIRWHKIEDGAELLTLLPHADRERWVLWTPEGYYASSPGAGPMLGWHVNRGRDRAPDFYPITAYGGFFQPAALPLVLRELETPRALGLAKVAYDREVVRQAVDSPVPPGPQLHVLTVGVSEYEHHERLRLDFADDDARDLANALLGQEGGLYAKVNVQHLTDARATQRAFFAALRVMLGAMQPGQQDVAVVQFSGHGATVDGELYLLPSDVETDGPDAIATTGIEVRKLKELLRRLGERGKVLVLLDACHSGGVVEGSKDVAPPDVEAVRAELAAAGTGVVVLTSSSEREVSREDPDWRNGAFTEAVLEALAGQADRDGDRWLSVSELQGYVVRRVRELTKNAQNPRIAALGEQVFEARLFVAGRP
jgi:WD40 repeat protein